MYVELEINMTTVHYIYELKPLTCVDCMGRGSGNSSDRTSTPLRKDYEERSNDELM